MAAAEPLAYSNSYIRGILTRTKTIAIVGASDNPARPSWIVLKYLLARGFTVFAVNPALAASRADANILGAPVYAKLADIPVPLDMVEIFRNSAAAGPIVDEALALDPKPRAIWMQLTVRNDAAAARAQAAGLDVVMDRCPKIEYARLSGEIGWSGVNSQRLSSKKPVMMKGFQKRTLDQA